MSLYGFAAFCAVYLLAVATPGPGVAAVLTRSLAHGMRGAPAFIAGFLVGDLIWFAGASAGLAALAQSAQTVFLIVRYAGAVYLLYLAYRLWTAPARPLDVSERRVLKACSSMPSRAQRRLKSGAMHHSELAPRPPVSSACLKASRNASLLSA